MLSFIYNLIEAIIGLVLRWWRPPLKAEVTFLKLICNPENENESSSYYQSKITIINRSRDALYTESISLTIDVEKTFRRRDGSDRIRIDTKQPLKLELSFPITSPEDKVEEGHFFIEIKTTSGKSIKVNGLFPLDINSTTS